MAKNYFKSQRWNAGIQNKLEAVTAGVDDDVQGGALQALITPVADLALTYYDKRIRAYFRRANIEIGNDVLTVESIRRKIETSTGLEIAELTAAGILIALEKPLARALSELLGFVVTAVFDQVELRRQVKEHVIQRLADGEGGGILKGRTLHRLREAATFARLGVGAGEKRKIMNRVYHRRYRASHPQTWV
jgi:hypothetical protein